MEGKSNKEPLPYIGIRDATAADAPALAKLADQLGYPTKPAEVIARLSQNGSRQERVIVATNNADEVIAWTTVRIASHIHSAPYAEISGFIVDQSVRRKGVGRRLMVEVERWAIGNGLFTIRLSANVKRIEAHLFYESLGFKATKQQYAFWKEL